MGLIGAARHRIAAIGRWLKRRLRPCPLHRIAGGDAALKEVARRSSCSVQDVSSRLGLPLGTTTGILVQLERQGLVRLSKDRIETNRIVAITTKGRQELRAIDRTRP